MIINYYLTKFVCSYFILSEYPPIRLKKSAEMIV